MGLDKDPPEGPKQEFQTQAEPGDPDAGSGNTVFVASRPAASAPDDDADTGDEARRVQEELEEHHREHGKKKDKDNGDQATVKPGDGDLPTHSIGRWAKAMDAWKLGIHDRGSYLKFVPDQKNLQEQIRAAILREVFQKGHKTIYFYRNGQIDLGVSAQADTILHKMIGQGVIPREVQISMQRMDEAEPWLGWWGKMRRDARNEKYDERAKKASQREYGFVNGPLDRFLGRGKGEREIVKRFGKSALPDKPPQGPPARQEESIQTAAADSAASPGNGTAPEKTVAADAGPVPEQQPVPGAIPPTPAPSRPV